MSLDFSNVKSWNIPEGEVLSASLNGVQVWEKQSPTPTWNDVTFIDYDGTILYSYSAAEFLNLSALPANYDHTSLGDGLGQGTWNCEYEGLVKQVQNCGKAIVGQTCELLLTDRINELDSNPKYPCYTLFYEDVSDVSTAFSPFVYNSKYSKIYFDTGETAEAVQYSNTTPTYKTMNCSSQGNHVYTVATYNGGVPTSTDPVQQRYYHSIDQGTNSKSEIGYRYSPSTGYKTGGVTRCSKVTKVYVSNFNTVLNDKFMGTYWTSLRYINMAPTFSGGSSSDKYSSILGRTNVETIVLPKYFSVCIHNASNGTTVGTGTSSANSSVKVISYPIRDVTSIPSSGQTQCPSTNYSSNLERAYIPYYVTMIVSSFNNCPNLKEVILPNAYNSATVQMNACFGDCQSLESIKFTSTRSSGMYFFHGACFQNLPTTCKIYVPSSLMTEYKALSGMPDPTVYEYIGY